MAQRWWRCLVVSLLATACVSYTPGIGADDGVNRAHAYLYGRFMRNAAGGGQGLSVGLVIGCADGSRYTIGVQGGNEIQVLEINPARCSFDEILFVAGSERQGHSYPAPPMGRSIDYLAGRAYYLGDFGVQTSHATDWKVLYTEHQLSWRLRHFDGRYPTTTAEMKRQFPRLQSLPTEDTQLAPRQQAATAQGTDAPSNESPLTPERVAILAPFIKRTYRSPAECAGSCGMGQCLPFRGESGAAMACVTRCNSDRGCPRGLACNCPNDEKSGDACQPIATTPTDPMARICLSPDAPR